MVGGDGIWITRGTITQPLNTYNAFGHIDFEATKDLSLFTESSFSRTEGEMLFLPAFFSGGTAFTAFNDNPYLPASVRSQMAAAGLTSIRVGRASEDWGRGFGTSKSDSVRVATGFNYNLSRWKLSGYVDGGKTTIDQDTVRNLNKSRAYEAADAVTDPATGQVVCRSTLTNPQNGCVPLNIFGVGSASPASVAYIQGHGWTRSWSKQLASELALRGSPLSIWAGDVQVAAGVTYRKLSAAADADPVSTSIVTAAPGSKGTPPALLGVLGGWLVGNQVNQPRADYSVKEGFGEVTIPLASELPAAYAADVNAAVRYADYSVTGGVISWKVGLSYAPTPDIRLRLTRSRDVRAPNLAELFGAQSLALASVTDPLTKSTATIAAYSSANPVLQPEFANTSTIGIVLTPRFVEGLNLAVDYYDIEVKGAIAALAAQDLVNLCAAGNTQYCQFVTRLPSPSNTIVSVNRILQNHGGLRAKGIDVEANYSTRLDRFSKGLPGWITARALASYLDHLTTIDAFGASVEHAGVNGGETVATPRWQATLSLAWTNNPWTVYAQERFISSGIQNTNGTLSYGNPYVSGTGPGSIDNNHVPAVVYTDLTGQYQLGDHLQLYGTVNNLLNKDPPEAPTRAGIPITTLDTNATLYDVAGRYFTVGFRLRY
jgi:outer membrane receptor protein involved in Fe transport